MRTWDLMTGGGITFEVDKDFQDLGDDEEYGYKDDVRLTNEDLLKLLNMNDFCDEDVESNDERQVVLPFGSSFDKLKQQMTDLTGDGKVMKVVRQNGVGEIIPCNAQVTIKYIGYFEYQDEPFDSTYNNRNAYTLNLSCGECIVGLEIGIRSMRKHEVAHFIIHPDLAFGKMGCLPRIPPNEDVLFAVHVVDFIEKAAAEVEECLTYEEKRMFFRVVNRVKDQMVIAGQNFKKQKTRQAIRDYRKVVVWLETAQLNNDEEEKEMNRLLSRAYTNLAVCFNKEGMGRQACMACNSVPIPTAKTHFNYGRALLKIGEYTRALEKLKIANKMEPRNKDVIQEIQLVNEKQSKYLEIEKKLWSKCVDGSRHERVSQDFTNGAKQLCEAFAHDTNLMRQPLPESLTKPEEKCVREQAALLGLNVTSHIRYGKEIVYLSKPQY
ncbi:inactive peptidyl-prolyl cis-trans isomerase FKBP6 isoform X2 [Cephus cinctus]|uniref:peptidylprolyl isomerase n=1 Tax=Cephus cinctus TaxID=211228 RepID=A0AAJ7VX32_CEPCN|nr:inactive peptidyl-prolyl cis-trans isomerase FKBP6 isoform X2 [Cephus cinctus]